MPKIPKRAARKRAEAVRPAPRKVASFFCYPEPLPAEFVTSVQKLEAAIDKNILLFVHVGEGHPCHICPVIWRNFVASKAKLRRPKMALLVDSLGGSAMAAYQVSMLLRKQCGKFTAIVPRIAKSAATLMVLGADKIIMGDEAELGPLDAQYYDSDDEEDWVSALDTVQALERLEENASQVATNMLEYLHKVTDKSYNLLIQHALHFAANITRPLFEKLDPRQYCHQARVLKEAQDYAERLLRARFTPKEAKAIADALVSNYPAHTFVIDRDEARRLTVVNDEEAGIQHPIGLDAIEPPNAAARTEIDWLANNMDGIVAFGYLADVPKEGEEN
jgi:hypothetical protein